jgi:hypothetical protein
VATEHSALDLSQPHELIEFIWHKRGLSKTWHKRDFSNPLGKSGVQSGQFFEIISGLAAFKTRVDSRAF